MIPSPGDLIFSQDRVPTRVRSRAPHGRPNFGKCHPRPWNFQDPCDAPLQLRVQNFGTRYLPPPTAGPEFRGSFAPSLIPELRGPPATLSSPSPEFRGPLAPPLHPRSETSETPLQPPAATAPELREPLALSSPRPRLRNFGAPAPSQALELRGSPSRPQPPYLELREPPAPSSRPWNYGTPAPHQ